MHDVHTHFIPNDVLTWIKDNRSTINATWEKKATDKEKFLIINQKWGFELKEPFINADLYLEEQHKVGISHSLISPIPQLFLYDFPFEVTNELSYVYNKSLADWIKSKNNRLSGLATVPLNNPEEAANVLKKSMSSGLKGAIIAPMCNGYMVTHEKFTPFWKEADRLEAIVFIHPLLNDDPRIQKRKMPNLIGVPWETTICATDIVLSGILDKYANVKILLAHGGGFFPYQIGRIIKGYEEWSAVSETIKTSPLQYMKRFWYDSVLLKEETVSYLMQLVGEERVVPGSDYPFDLSSWPPTAQNEKGIHELLFK